MELKCTEEEGNLKSAESDQVPQNGKENVNVSRRDRLSWEHA